MTQKTEEMKQKMKEEYAKKVDEYFSQIDEMKENGNFSINDIEELLGNGISAAKEILTATTEEIIKQELDTCPNEDSKKTCPTCGKVLNMWDKSRSITITTIHGPLTFRRPYWYCRKCNYGVCPDDQGNRIRKSLDTNDIESVGYIPRAK